MKNCIIVMNETDPAAATAKARTMLLQDAHPSRHAETETVELMMEPEIVPEGWGFPPRVVVTFDPKARYYDVPRRAD